MSGLIRKFDPILLGCALFLMGIGIVVLFSISVNQAIDKPDFNAWYQVVFAAIGMLCALLIWQTDYRQWQHNSLVFYAITILLLVVVLFAGDTAGGATRWIDIGPFRFQPSELMKFALILLLARLFANRGGKRQSLSMLALSLLYVAVPAALIVVQPDLGTSISLLFIWFVMLMISQFPKPLLVLGLVATVGIVPLVYPSLEPYQQERINTFLDPSADPQGSGYNVAQSTIAVGSGQLFGKGLDGGTQSQLNFLPSQQTDFIFAVIAEKLGFVGASLVLIAFTTIISRAFYIAYRAKDRFSYYLASGVGAYFVFHALINIGMNIGLLPVTGLPLPFVSYGGTNLLVSWLMLGLLLSIQTHDHELHFA